VSTSGVSGVLATQLINAIQNNADQDVVIRTGVTLSASSGSGTISVALDNDPSQTPCTAISTGYNAIQVGTRVLLVAYPTRGLAVIGVIGNPPNPLTASNQFQSASYNLVTSTSYSTNSNMAGFPFSYPPSGRVMVYIRSSIQWTSGTLAVGDGVCFSFNIRDSIVTGAVQLATSDDRALICRLYAGASGAGPSGATAAALGAPNFTEYFGSVAILLTGLPTTGTGYLQPMTRTLSAPAGPFWAASRTEYIVVPQP
jgi:hypothetical protein